MPERELNGAVLAERRPAREHLVHDDADAVDVGRGRRAAAAGLLGRHVTRGADDRRAGAVGAALGEPGDAEVAYLQPPLERDQDVGGLDVTVDHALGVGLCERLAELLGDPGRLPRRDRAALEPRSQALPIYQLGHVVEALVGLADVEDLDDAGVTDACQQPRLALEIGRPIGILGPPGLDHLDRDSPLQPAIPAAVDAPEGPLADHGMEFVAVVQGAA